MAARHYTTSAEDKAEILAYAPGLSALSTAQLEQVITWTARVINLQRWGRKTSDGHLLLIAHVGTVQGAGAAAAPSGAVTARTIGGISTSYGAAAVEPGEGNLNGTGYGQQYLLLRRSIVVVPLGTGRFVA